MAHDWTATIGRHGPNAYLQINFQGAPDQQLRLRLCVAELVAPEYEPVAPVLAGRWAARSSNADYYLDPYTAERLAQQSEKNYYGPYASLTVTDSSLFDERYGAPDLTESIPRMVRALITEKGFTVLDWSIIAGGDGYDSVSIAAGDAAALIALLGI